MVYFTGERGCGKSSHLISLSSPEYPIITNTSAQAEYIKQLAQKNGYGNVTVLPEYRVINMHYRQFPLENCKGLLIDEADKIIEKALLYHFGLPVNAVSLDGNHVFLLKDHQVLYLDDPSQSWRVDNVHK